MSSGCRQPQGLHWGLEAGLPAGISRPAQVEEIHAPEAPLRAS